MNRMLLRLALLGGLLCGPVRAEPIQLTLSAGIGSTTTDADGFVFDSSGRLVLERIRGVGTADVVTADGRITVGAGDLPLVLSTLGRVTVSSGAAPTSLTSGAIGATADGEGPRMTVGVYDWGLLSVWVADGSGRLLGGSEVTIPDGGWWVIGLRRVETSTDSERPAADPLAVPDAAGVSEPSALVLVAVGTIGLAAIRLAHRRSFNRRGRACIISS